MAVVEGSFIVLQAHKSFTDLSLAGADRLYLRALEHHSALDTVINEKVALRFGIADFFKPFFLRLFQPGMWDFSGRGLLPDRITRS